MHVPKDFTHPSRSFILFLAGYIPICASQVSSFPQCCKQRYLKYFWPLLQCSRVHHLGFCTVSVGSSLPAFYTLMLHKILEDKKPKLFDINLLLFEE